jgi:hypothetical protein
VAVDMEVVGDEEEEVAVTAEVDTVEEEVRKNAFLMLEFLHSPFFIIRWFSLVVLLCFHRPINLH